MRFLFLTDSLSLPRNGKVEKVSYEETYPYLLKKTFPQHDFVFLGIGGSTIKDLYRQSSYYVDLKPDLTFIQCGIVDCAPRPFRKLETRIINKLKLRFLFKPFVKWLVKNRGYKYTKIKTFDNTIKELLSNQFQNYKNYAIGILPASVEYEQKLKGITQSINDYNNVLKSNYTNHFIDNTDFPKNGLLSDFHHLNAKGHQFIFKKISKIIHAV